MLYWKLHISVAGDCDVDTEIKTDNVHYTKSSQNMLYWKPLASHGCMPLAYEQLGGGGRKTGEGIGGGKQWQSEGIGGGKQWQRGEGKRE